MTLFNQMFYLQTIFFYELCPILCKCEIRNHRVSLVRVQHLRDIFEGVFQFFPEILHVGPLLLGKRLPAHVNVLHTQLFLIKKPLNHKQWSCNEQIFKEKKSPPLLLQFASGLTHCCKNT